MKTAFDVLQEMKEHAYPMTEHVYNELIRTYAGACLVPDVEEKHVDMYVKDAFDLFHNLLKDSLEPNIHILNSLVYLHACALRPEQLEAEVLPLFEKYRTKHDVYTY